MERVLYSLLILLIVFLSSCSELDNLAKDHPELVPDEEGKYLLHSIGDEITREQLDEENIHIYGVNNRSSFNDFNENYPELELDDSPAYILFDESGLIFKTYDYDELIQYIKENPQGS